MQPLKLNWWNVANALQRRSVTPSVDAFKGSRFEVTSRGVVIDDFGLEEADDGLGQRVVLRLTNTVDGRLNPGFVKTYV